MGRRSRGTTFVLCLISLAAGMALTWVLLKKTTPDEPARAVATGELNWVDVLEVKGALRAVLWGDPGKGAYGAWNKWPGGTDAGTHTQSADSKAVVMAGTIVLSLEGGPAKELSAGSYINVPANQVRSMKCREGSDCIFLAAQPDKFDFKLVLPAPKK